MTASILPITSQAAVQQAVALLREGEIVLVPTDTVYGMAVLPQDCESIAQLYRARARVPEPALPLLLAAPNLLETYARANRPALRLAQRFWPGPLTMLLSPRPELPSFLRTKPLALRVPNYPALQALIAALGGYLVVTGASQSGYSPAITAQEAAAFFGNSSALILDGGPTPFGVTSTIVDCTTATARLIRRGAVAEEKLWAALKA